MIESLSATQFAQKYVITIIIIDSYKLDYYRICFIGTVRHCEERSNLKQSNPFRLLRVENPRNDATYNAFIF
jgi:hypothetical protein